MGAEALGLLLSAISGGGNAALTNLQEQQKQQGAIDLEQAKSDADIARQKAAIDYNIAATNANRGLLASQFNDALKQNTDAATLANLHANPDYQGEGADQQDVTDVSQMSDQAIKDNAPNQAEILNQTGLQTGQISPEQLAASLNKSDVAQIRAQAILDRTNQMIESAKSHGDVMLAIQKMKDDVRKEAGASGYNVSPLMQKINYMAAHPDAFSMDDIKRAAMERPQESFTDVVTKLVEQGIDPDKAAIQARQIMQSAAGGTAVSAPTKPFDPADFTK